MGGKLSQTVRGMGGKLGQLIAFLGVSTLCGLLCAAMVIPIVGSLAYGVSAGTRAVASLPSAIAVPVLAGRTYVYDRNHGLVATFFSEDRVDVPLAKIAPVMQQALVDIEDERFYDHGAVDPRGLVRALVSNSQEGDTTQGASTLTQQYVKNILKNEATTPAEIAAATAKTLARKVAELRYSIALEQKLTKAQILEGYLNIAPFGQSVYGVEAASEYYFDTTAAKLTLAQAAMLAGEVQAPSLYDPTAGGTHVVQAIDRRKVVLDKMLQLRHISPAAYRTAVASPLGIHKTVPKQSCYAASVSKWYCDYVLKTLLGDSQLAVLGATSEVRQARIYAGGLAITTALDPGVQRRADAGMAAASDPTDTPVASTAIVRPGTGDVLAVANSKHYGSDAAAGQSLNDYAVPFAYGNAIGFQPGSGMKPITMAVALEQGLGLDHRIDAASGLRYDQFRFRNCAGDNVAGGPAPILNEAGQSYGSITMLQGIWESVNSYFAQLESQVGLCPVARLAAKLGVTTVGWAGGAHATPLLQVPTLTLGTNVTSPLQMSEVYATLADHGVYCPPRVVTKIVDTATGRTLYDPGISCRRVIPAGVADAIDWALHHNVLGDLDRRSTATPAKVVEADGTVIPTAGKTGTNDSHQAVWFNGYNAQFAASVVLAMPTTVDRFGNPTTLVGETLGGATIRTATGGTAAGGVWLKIMAPILEAQGVHPDFPAEPAPAFRVPGQYTGTSVNVPDVVGAQLAAAESELTAAQLQWTVAADPVTSPLPAGTVVSTDPAGTSQVDARSSVTITVSSGP